MLDSASRHVMVAWRVGACRQLTGDVVTTGTETPDALRRVLPLLVNAPAQPDISRGYLDLLGPQPASSPGPIQAAWASSVGSMLYDYAQALGRKVLSLWEPPSCVRNPQPGARALDVGCGPGNVTANLGRALGTDGLAIGLDVSEPMLARAVGSHTPQNVGFIRGDALQLPFHPATFDLVISFAALQLIPEPFRVLGQMTRMLVPGGRLALLVPTERGSLSHRVSRLIGITGGIEFLDPDDLADTLADHGMDRIHTRNAGPVLWVTARKTG